MVTIFTNVEEVLDEKIKKGMSFKECEQLIKMECSVDMRPQARNFINHRLANGFFSEVSIKEAEKLKPGIFKNPPQIEKQIFTRI